MKTMIDLRSGQQPYCPDSNWQHVSLSGHELYKHLEYFSNSVLYLISSVEKNENIFV